MALQPSQGGEGDFNAAPFTGNPTSEAEFEAWLDDAVAALRGDTPPQRDGIEEAASPGWVEASGLPVKTIDLTGRSIHQRDLPHGQTVKINVPGSTVYLFPAEQSAEPEEA